jgi:putative transposase
MTATSGGWRTTSLVRAAGGTPRGADRLAPEIAGMIERCIERFCLTRRKLTGVALFDVVRHECRKADLKPQSLSAVRRRAAAKRVAAVVRAREGAAVAAQRFRPVPGGLETPSPVQGEGVVLWSESLTRIGSEIECVVA